LGRDGKKKAALALAHTLVRIIYYVLSTHNHYLEFGSDFGSRSTEARAERMARELAKMGYTVAKAA
jgi:hypothetical protein